MARLFSVWILFMIFALAGDAQTRTSSDIGIDEKLGARVAIGAALRDESGKPVTLRQYLDKPTILMFNYFRCPGICPVMINSMVDAVNRMQLEPGKDYRLIAVSFDPTDTPGLAREKKANYLNQMRRPFSPDSWHFLTGDPENVKVVTDSAGFKYLPQGDMYVHPGAVMVLTSEGRISRYLYGTNYLPAEVAMAVQEARAGQVRPSISRVLSFCYTYDPKGRTYVFNVTRIFGVITLAVAGIWLGLVLRQRKKGLHA
jgi:protein SCO1/2